VQLVDKEILQLREASAAREKSNEVYEIEE
jgi:hypothetical protein